ncbi:unnamed protein product [Schistocephalus solidus]|uniref:Reverse transcriptase domain-containing protein n=1 Tax=Schistocephalus solidus TaxID=70667 RepID=A0A183SR36_SCHSO|nr:unnamed protein product [Schistocephalus solidus]
MLRQVQLRWSGHLVRMDNERLAKQLFYGHVKGTQIKNVETFAYLGSTLSSKTRIEEEVAQRISKASQAFGWLQASMWNHLDCLLEPNQEAESLQYQLPPQNTEGEMARQDLGHGIVCIHAMLRQVQLRWSGHLVRMDNERLAKQLFYGHVATAACRYGGQKLRYKDILKKSLKQLQINPVTWEDLTQDRPAWKRSTKTGAVIPEANRITAAKAKSRLASGKHLGSSPPMPKPCQRAHAVNAHSARESAWSDIFEVNATIIPYQRENYALF